MKRVHRKLDSALPLRPVEQPRPGDRANLYCRTANGLALIERFHAVAASSLRKLKAHITALGGPDDQDDPSAIEELQSLPNNSNTKENRKPRSSVFEELREIAMNAAR
jgi:hypothetical protein